jgi:hypothetical protein
VLSTHLDDDVRALRGGCCANLGPLFRHQDNASILFVPARILLSFVQDAKVIGLRDANKLTVIAFGPHYAPVIQFVHGRRYPETKNKKMTKFLNFKFRLREMSFSFFSPQLDRKID